MAKLNKEEKDLLESFERGEWQPVKNMMAEMRKAKEAARVTFTKDQRMNIRISKKDLDGLKLRAREEGIPYQTLVSSIIHKFISGKLVESR
jgi:predicted DNA binding CopG/RHH family protein